MSRFLSAAVCTFLLSACATGTALKGSEPIPRELIPEGYTAADCHVVREGHADTDNGPGGGKFSHGSTSPQVQCTKQHEGPVTVTKVGTCHTQGGKELPPAACCLTPSGDPIPNCTPKNYPPGE